MRRLLPLAVLAALAPSAWLAWNFRDLPHLGQYHDDGIYWATARALAVGSGYRIVSFPGAPHQTKYPPLYPFWLSLVWKLSPSFPGNLPLAMLLTWVLLPLFVWTAGLVLVDLGFDLTRRRLLCAAIALNPTVCLVSISLMADVAFGVLLFGALALLTRARSYRGVALAGALGGAAYLTRTAGGPLLVAGTLWLLLRRQPKRAWVFLASMAPAVAGWNAWVHARWQPSADFTVNYYTSYLAFPKQVLAGPDLGMFLSNNIYFLVRAISRLLVYYEEASVLGGFYWRLLAFGAVAGAIRLARTRGLSPYHLFAGLLLLAHLVWPWPPDDRMILPLLPLLLAGLFAEVNHILMLLRAGARQRAAAARAASIAIVAILVSFAAAALYCTAQALTRFFPEKIREHRQLLAAARPAYEWIANHLPANARLLAYDDPVVALYTRRQASSIPVPPALYYREGSPGVERLLGSAVQFAQRHGLGYIMITVADFYRGELSPVQRDRLHKALRASPELLLIYQSPMVAILECRACKPAATRLSIQATAAPESLSAAKSPRE